jgi:hypothetical protein
MQLKRRSQPKSDSRSGHRIRASLLAHLRRYSQHGIERVPRSIVLAKCTLPETPSQLGVGPSLLRSDRGPHLGVQVPQVFDCSVTLQLAQTTLCAGYSRNIRIDGHAPSLEQPLRHVASIPIVLAPTSKGIRRFVALFSQSQASRLHLKFGRRRGMNLRRSSAAPPGISSVAGHLSSAQCVGWIFIQRRCRMIFRVRPVSRQEAARAALLLRDAYRALIFCGVP